MSKYIGKLINVGFGIEAVRGESVAVQNWQPKTDLSFVEKFETINDESGIGSIVDSQAQEIVKKWGEGDIVGNVYANSFGYILYSLLGGVVTSEDSVGAYLHTFSLAESNTHPSLTVGIDDPTTGDESFAMGMINSITITADEGDFVKFTVNFKAKNAESASHTVTYNTDYRLLSRHSTFKTATNLAGLDGASSVCLKSFELTINKNLTDDFCIGSLTPADFLNGVVGIEGSFSLYYASNTYKDLAFDGTPQAMRFDLVDTGTTIGATSNPSLRFDLPKVGFTEWAKTQGNDEFVMQTLTYKGNYSKADTSAINTYLTNTIEEYSAGSVS